MILPLWTRKGIIGTLSLGWPRVHPLTTDDLGFLRTIAAQIAVGLDSARLYEHKATVAETLQQALLTLPGSLPGVRFGHLYRSATEAAYVGGDFYDVFSLDADRIAVLIGDVSGHGIEAATTASLIREVVRAYALDEDRPESVVAKTNRALLLRDTPGFATLFLATLDLTAGTLAYCAAGHPPAFIGRDGGGVTPLDRFNPALNVSEEALYTPGLETFGPRDFLLLYTDGVIESRRGRELFGEARLAKLVAGSSWDKVEQLPRRILSQLQRFSRGRLRDDLAIVAVAREPEPKPRRTRSTPAARGGVYSDVPNLARFLRRLVVVGSRTVRAPIGPRTYGRAFDRVLQEPLLGLLLSGLLRPVGIEVIAGPALLAVVVHASRPSPSSGGVAARCSQSVLSLYPPVPQPYVRTAAFARRRRPPWGGRPVGRVQVGDGYPGGQLKNGRTIEAPVMTMTSATVAYETMLKPAPLT